MIDAKKTAVWPVLAITAMLAVAPVFAEKKYDVSEVRVIEAAGEFMYAYYDINGQLVVQDVPPPGYLESLAASQANKPEASVKRATQPVPAPTSDNELPVWLVPALWLLSGMLLVAALFIRFAPLLRRVLTETRLDRRLRRTGWPLFKNINLTFKPYGATKIDCLACTPSGVLVIKSVRFTGKIDGQPNHDVWLQSIGKTHLKVDNPLLQNDRDMQIVQGLIGDVPVHGRVIYTGGAEIPKGMPSRLQKLTAFSESLESFETATPDQRSLSGGWRVLMRYPHSNHRVARPLGTGWQRWLREHWRQLISVALLTIAVAIMLLLTVMHSVGRH